MGHQFAAETSTANKRTRSCAWLMGRRLYAASTAASYAAAEAAKALLVAGETVTRHELAHMV
jgi:hypothetical protein